MDADGSGRFESAYEIASRVINDEKDLATVLPKLEGYDEAVVAQAIGILASRVSDGFSNDAKLMERTSPVVRRGMQAFLRDWEAAQKK